MTFCAVKDVAAMGWQKNLLLKIAVALHATELYWKRLEKNKEKSEMHYG